MLGSGEECTGLIDFGDTVHSQVINNLAIALAYVMIASPEVELALIVKSYHAEFPLEDKELEGTYFS